MKFEKKYLVGGYINGALFVSELPREKGARVGMFKCPHCGTDFKYRVSKMSESKNNSCGCTSYSSMRRNVIHGHNSYGKHTPEYASWHSMMQRCFNTKNIFYKFYGAKGRTVCERWKSFKLFFEDMGERPSIHHSLDRYPNNEGDYEPGNCRWATRAQQAANTSRTQFVMYGGEKVALPLICAKLGIKGSSVTGWKWYKKCDIQEAFEYILKKKGLLEAA